MPGVMENSPSQLPSAGKRPPLAAGSLTLPLCHATAVPIHRCRRKLQSVVKKERLPMICVARELITRRIILPFMIHRLLKQLFSSSYRRAERPWRLRRFPGAFSGHRHRSTVLTVPIAIGSETEFRRAPLCTSDF